jgi:hypothetical protein
LFEEETSTPSIFVIYSSAFGSQSYHYVNDENIRRKLEEYKKWGIKLNYEKNGIFRHRVRLANCVCVFVAAETCLPEVP